MRWLYHYNCGASLHYCQQQLLHVRLAFVFALPVLDVLGRHTHQHYAGCIATLWKPLVQARQAVLLPSSPLPKEVPFRFPGSLKAYDSLVSVTDANLLAKSME